MNLEKERQAIERLKAFQPLSEPYYLCYSGGKDSDCIRILAELAGVNYDTVHNLTTLDAPETVRYVKSIPNIIISRPELTAWQLIVKKKMPFTRVNRYCCEVLKESGGRGRVKVTGVRWAESTKRAESAGLVKVIGKPKTMRKKAEAEGLDYKVTRFGGLVLNDDNDENRRFVEHCYRTTSTMINPIVDWTDDDVWSFLRHYDCRSNPLYECGHKRVGCVGCPMRGSKGMKKDFAKYPKYRALYVKAFDKMLDARASAGLANSSWYDGESVMRWWVQDDPNQITFEDLEM